MPGLTIIQAWQADETPAWIATCLASVRGWAAMRGYRYTCTDQFFDVVPAALRAHCGAETGPLTDVARTELMAAAHADGADLAVWIDADVLIFDPANFAIDTSPGFFGIRERAVLLDASGRALPARDAVNGAILGAARGDRHFATYRRAMAAVITAPRAGPIPRTCAGPDLLTRLAAAEPFMAIDHIGLITPTLCRELAAGRRELAQITMAAFGSPMVAANLCHFYRGTLPAAARPAFDAMMAAVTAMLLTSNGALLNGLLPAG